MDLLGKIVKSAAVTDTALNLATEDGENFSIEAGVGYKLKYVTGNPSDLEGKPLTLSEKVFMPGDAWCFCALATEDATVSLKFLLGDEIQANDITTIADVESDPVEAPIVEEEEDEHG